MPKILQGVNERLPDLVTNILSQKDFVSTAGYDDESDEEESDREAGAQNNQMVRDAVAQQTGNKDTGAQQTENADAQNFVKRDVNTPQITSSRENDSDSTNNKIFDNVDGLL